MTVSVEDSSKRFHGSGSTGPFTWPWRFLANEDIKVYRILEPNEDFPWLEDKVLLVEGSDYTLTGATSYTGGSLVLAVALAVDTDLYIERYTEMLQDISIRNQGNNFRPEIHEDVFDRLTMMVQDRERRLAYMESKSFEITILQASTGIADMSEVDATAGNVVVNLPLSGSVSIVKSDATANTVTLNTTDGSTIIYETSYVLSGQDEFVQLTKFGTNWRRS